MFCCVGLKNLIGTAGQRGMSILVSKTPRGFRFNLQSRALSREAELYLTRVPTPLLPLPIQGDKKHDYLGQYWLELLPVLRNETSNVGNVVNHEAF